MFITVIKVFYRDKKKYNIFINLFFAVFSVLFILTISSCFRYQALTERGRLLIESGELLKQGRIVEFLEIEKKMLALDEKVFGPNSSIVGSKMFTIGLFSKSIGDYAQAEHYFKRSIEITEKDKGPNYYLHLGANLHQLAEVYIYLGDYDKAEALLKRAMATYEKIGSADEIIATSNHLLGRLYYMKGSYSTAMPFLRKALSLYENINEHGSSSSFFRVAERQSEILKAMRLLTMADLYEKLGNNIKAEQFYEEGLPLLEKGPSLIGLSFNLCKYGMFCLANGDATKAETLLKRSMDICERSFGSSNSILTENLNALATIAVFRNDFTSAYPLFQRAQTLEANQIDEVMRFTSDNQKMTYLEGKQFDLYRYLSFVSQYFSSEPDKIQEAFTIWLQRKGIVLEAQRSMQEALVSAEKPEVKKKYEDLANVRTRLARLQFAGPELDKKEGEKVYQKNIEELENNKAQLEADLSRMSVFYATNKKLLQADSNLVQSALPPNSVLIDFLRLPVYNFNAKVNEKKYLQSKYLAFVVRPEKNGKVAMIDLGSADEIDRIISAFKRGIASKDIAGRNTLQAAGNLYAKVFLPLEKTIGDAKYIFISADGNLNLLPFEVFQGPDGKFIIEKYTINYLTAGRDIIAFGKKSTSINKSLFIGDPDFDFGIEKKHIEGQKLAVSSSENKLERSVDMKNFRFSRLPGTGDEVRAIQKLFGGQKADIYTDKMAVDKVLQINPSPFILHLATHGFFLSDQGIEDYDNNINERGVNIVSKAPVAETKFENPLLRSGIALSGANKTLQSGDIGMNDGIITAEKILGIRLQGTDMVVLSACETGLGEVKSGEGVFGIRRAFMQAGAKSLVMSMWQVPDMETKELMVAFYNNIIFNNMNRAQALRDAMLQQMKVTNKRYASANPYFWGAFILLGEPSANDRGAAVE